MFAVLERVAILEQLAILEKDRSLNAARLGARFALAHEINLAALGYVAAGLKLLYSRPAVL